MALAETRSSIFIDFIPPSYFDDRRYLATKRRDKESNAPSCRRISVTCIRYRGSRGIDTPNRSWERARLMLAKSRWPRQIRPNSWRTSLQHRRSRPRRLGTWELWRGKPPGQVHTMSAVAILSIILESVRSDFGSRNLSIVPILLRNNNRLPLWISASTSDEVLWSTNDQRLHRTSLNFQQNPILLFLILELMSKFVYGEREGKRGSIVFFLYCFLYFIYIKFIRISNFKCLSKQLIRPFAIYIIL